MSDIIRTETAHEINGVPGRLFTLRAPPAPWKPNTFASQNWVSDSRPVRGYGADARMTVELRFDDDCRNERNTFAITAEIHRPKADDIEAGGCLHEEIAKYFPELAPLIKWHLCSTDGPMHYLANTVYLAGNRDHNGLLMGEKRQIRNGKTGLPSWKLAVIVDGVETNVHDIEQYLDGETQPVAPELRYVPWFRVGEGKARKLDAARSAAVWPGATDEELSAEPEVLREVLKQRLPQLLANFRADIESIGFMWTCPSTVENEQ